MFVGIVNTPRDYAWGSSTAIPRLLGAAPTGEPQAEYWLGAHPGSPSRLAGREGTLQDLVPDGLPFLMKVLAPVSSVSLQAHPSVAQAEAGFAREEAAGVAVDAPERNYKDRNSKPEMVYALGEPFGALAGFRPVAETRAVLEPAAAHPAIRDLLGKLTGDESLRDVFTWLLSGRPEVADLTAAVSAAAATMQGPSWATVRGLAESYPGDPGIPISLLLHMLTLEPGEALYLPAGNIHAYQYGVGIEVLANSDNVIRGGLTPKHVDVAELLEILDFRPLPAPYLRPEVVSPGVSVFRPGIPDFMLTVVSPDAAGPGAHVSIAGGGPAIAFVVSGAVTLDGAESSFTLEPGAAAYLRGEESVRVQGNGLTFLATSGAERGW
ncbi:MAG TPA: mannose-6-phosphate isomerase, class I [Pseudolysinimonas sp.]|jgi:mannose-6-phosphate isomerase|nr:mannose-6-phosphate isomerase, class I [Pseudolysinimonas sp.]